MRVERTIAGITWSLLLGNRRWIALLVCNGLPMLIAWLVFLDQGRLEPDPAATLLGGIVVVTVITGLLPLAAVVFGTTAFGSELDDGTLIYLLAKPTARWRLFVAKWAAAAAATLTATLPGVILAGWIIMGDPLHPLVRGLAAGVLLSSTLYSALFMALSLFTRRALIVGLVYVLAWEGGLSRLFAGTRTLSVREYSTVVSELVADRPFIEGISSSLSPATAGFMSVVVLGGAVVLSVRRLRAFELVQRS